MPVNASLPSAERRTGISRRTVVGAAWSAPIILAAVATPQAAASDGTPLPTLVWIGSPGVFNETSTLIIDAPFGSSAVGQPGVLTLAVQGYGYVPSADVSVPPGWSYSVNGPQTLGTFTPPAAGLTLGNKAFTVTWGELSGNMRFLATWQSTVQPTAVVAPLIEVGPRGFPSLSWSVNPVEFGGSSTLRLAVPVTNTALGALSAIVDQAPWPAGMEVDPPAGWTFEYVPELDRDALITQSLTSGDHDFIFTFGPGTVETSIDPTWLGTSGQPTPIIAPEPLRIVPAEPTP